MDRHRTPESNAEDYHESYDIRKTSRIQKLSKETTLLGVAQHIETWRKNNADAEQQANPDENDDEMTLVDKNDFDSVEQFRKWLNDYGIDTQRWGSLKTKPISSLYAELKADNCIFVRVKKYTGNTFGTSSSSSLIDPLINRMPMEIQEYEVFRYVRVVRVSLKQEFQRNRVRFLLEDSQEMGNTGQIRYRNLLLSSSIRDGETSFSAAKRSVEKELQNIGGNATKGVSRKNVHIPHRDKLNVKVETVESQSYPDLRTRYVLFSVEANLNVKLPKTDFCTTEYLPTGHISVKHYWKWKTQSELERILDNSSFVRNDAKIRSILVSQHKLRNKSNKTVLLHDIYDEDFNPTLPVSVLKAKFKSWNFKKQEYEPIVATFSEQQVVTKEEFLTLIIPAVEELTIVVTGDVSLSKGHLFVLNRLFPRCCRVYAKLLHGGFSGSYVLQVQACAPGNLQLDPTVVKLDQRKVMREELHSYDQLAPYMGDCAPAILDTDVDIADDELTDNIGGLKFELVGAVWMLPDCRQSGLHGNTNLLNTFKTLYVYELENEFKIYSAHRKGQLGPSKSMALFRPCETVMANSVSTAAIPGGLKPQEGYVEETKGGDDDERGDECGDDDSNYGDDMREVFGEVPRVLKEVFGEILRKTTLLSREQIKINILNDYRIITLIHEEILQDHPVPEKKRPHLINIQEYDPDMNAQRIFSRFLELVKETGMDTQKFNYLHGLIHGDLNGMNILIDSQDIVWVIDFAFSGRGHVLRDITKLESCILYEYVQIKNEEDLSILKRMAVKLIRANHLCEILDNDILDSACGHLRFAWNSIKALRMYAGNYCQADPEPIQLVVSMLHFALRALHFRDLSDKRLPFFVAVECAKRLVETLETHRTLKPPVQKDLTSGTQRIIETMNKHLDPAQLEYEKKRYFHDIYVKESYVIDVITRDRVHIAEQTVELELIDGLSREQILSQDMDVDEMQTQRRLQKRLQALQGAMNYDKETPQTNQDEEDGHARFTTAMQVLSNQKGKAHRIVLGGAASGKSCLLRKILLSTIQEQSGSSDDVVPVLLLLIDLGRLMTKKKLNSEHDLLDIYLENVCGEGSARLAFFRKVREQKCLLILFDGLDEAGDHKIEIEKYIAKLSLSEPRITVSSRVTGFNDQVFRDFHFYQVMPLTSEMQDQIIDTRLGKRHPNLKKIKSELRKRQYTEIVRNPLMLSLLISLLSKQIEKSNEEAQDSEKKPSTQEHYTRAYLYKHAVAQLLHQSSMNKFGMRRGMDDKFIEDTTKVLASKLCYDYLKCLSFYAHSKRIRDFSPEVLTRLAGQHVKLVVYCPEQGNSQVLEQKSQQLFEMIGILQSAVFDGRCSLFAVSKVAVDTAASRKRLEKIPGPEDKDIECFNYVMRFVHLSFQEYLAGLYIVDNLQYGLDNNTFEETLKDLLYPVNSEDGILHDPWWQGVMLSMAGSMSDFLFEKFSQFLVQTSDSTGANIVLAGEMLAEIPESNFQDSASMERITENMKNGFKTYYTESNLVSALIHQSRHLQHIALTEVRRFSDPIQAAYAVVFGPGVDQSSVDASTTALANYPWYTRASAIQALAMIPEIKRDPVILGILIDFWGDESSLVRKSAVEAVKTLGAEMSNVVTHEILRQLCDEVETINGHELIQVLNLYHLPIIEQLLAHTTYKSSEWSQAAWETLKMMPPSPELCDCYCRAMSSNPSATIRQHAAQLVLSMAQHKTANSRSRRLSAGSIHIDDEIFDYTSLIEAAFIKWLDTPEDIRMVTLACETIKKLGFISGVVVERLKLLLKHAESMSSHQESANLWISAMEALGVMSQESFCGENFQSAVEFSLAHNLPAIRSHGLRLVSAAFQTNKQAAQLELLERVVSVIESDSDLLVRKTGLQVAFQLIATYGVEDKSIVDKISPVVYELSSSALPQNESLQEFVIGKVIKDVSESPTNDQITPMKAKVIFNVVMTRKPKWKKALQVLGKVYSDEQMLKVYTELILPKLQKENYEETCQNIIFTIEALSRTSWNIDIRAKVLTCIIDSYQEHFFPLEDEELKTQWCLSVENLGHAGWKIHDIEYWRKCFTSMDSFARPALVALLLPDFMVDVKPELINMISSNRAYNRRTRIAALKGLHKHGLLEDDLTMQNVFAKWLLRENDIDLLSTLTLLKKHGILCKPMLLVLFDLLTSHGQLSISKGTEAPFARLSTKDKLLIASLNEKHQTGSIRKSDTDAKLISSLNENTIYGCICKAIEDLVANSETPIAKDIIKKYLEGVENTQAVACLRLTKTRDFRGDPEIAELLFRIMGNSSTSEALLKLVTRTISGDGFRRNTRYNELLAPYIAHPNALVRKAFLGCMMKQPSLNIAEYLIFTSIDDIDPGVRKAAVELLFDWYITDSTDEYKLALKIESIFLSILEKSVAFDAPEEHDLNILVLCMIPRMAKLPDGFLKRLFALVNEHPLLSVRNQVVKTFSFIKWNDPEETLASLLKVHCNSIQAKTAWLAIVEPILQVFQRPRRGRDKAQKLTVQIKEKVRSYLQTFFVDMSEYGTTLLEDLIRVFSRFELDLGQEIVHSILESVGKTNTRVVKALLEYLLISKHARLSKSIIQFLCGLILEQSDQSSPNGNISASCLLFFSSYCIKDLLEADTVLNAMRDENGIAPFVFDALLNFFRGQRVNTGGTRWTLPDMLREKIDTMVKEGSIEASYLSKEMRVDFVVKPFDRFQISSLTLKGRGELQERRSQRKELELMRLEEWRMQRSKWFPVTPVDKELLYMSAPESCQYQRSRLTTMIQHIYINAIPGEMFGEIKALVVEVFPEVNRRLKALGVMVEVHPLIPFRFDAGCLLDASSEEQMKFNRRGSIRERLDLGEERKLAMVKSSAPFMLCLIGEQLGPIVKGEGTSISSKERSAAFLSRPSLPYHGLCYFRDSEWIQQLDDVKLRTAFEWDHDGCINYKNDFENEIREIRSHPFVKCKSYTLQTNSINHPPVPDPEFPKYFNVGGLNGFVESATEDIISCLLEEFVPQKQYAATCSSTQHVGSSLEHLDLFTLPFSLVEEQSFHEICLHSHSTLSRKNERFHEKTPKCRREIFTQTIIQMGEDVTRDNNLRHERRAVTNAAFRTKHVDLGNDPIVIVGKQGLGKTTFLSTFADLCRKSSLTRTPCVIFHSCGVSPSSVDIKLTLLRLGMELIQTFPTVINSTELQPPTEANLTLENVSEWWQKVLCSASEAAISYHIRPVIVVDNLFTGTDARFCKREEIWDLVLSKEYGRRVPPGLTFIFSACPCSEVFQRLEKQKRAGEATVHMKILELDILQPDERSDLLTTRLSNHGFTLAPSILSSVLKKTNAEYPLLLKHVCDEIVFHGFYHSKAKCLQAVESFPTNLTLEPPLSRTGSCRGVSRAVSPDMISVLEPFVQRLESVLSPDDCRIVLLLLTMVQWITEDDLHTICSQVSKSISSKSFKRFCILIDPLVECVPVMKVASRPIARPHGVRRRSKKFAHRTSLTVHGGPSSIVKRVISYRDSWTLEAIKLRYGSVETLGTSLEALHGVLCEYWTTKLLAWHSENRSTIQSYVWAGVRSIVPHALASDKPLHYLQKTLLDTKVLEAVISQVCLHSPFPDLLQDYSTALEFLERNNQSSSECFQSLKWFRQRIELNISELQQDPGLIQDLL